MYTACTKQLKTCHDTAKRAETRVGFYPLFLPDSDDRLSLNFHRFVILYTSCDIRSVGLGQCCLPNVYNGFKSLDRPGSNFIELLSIKFCLAWNVCLDKNRISQPNFYVIFKITIQQLITVTRKCNKMEIWLVILFLPRKKFYAKQIFVLSGSMKLGPVVVHVKSLKSTTYHLQDLWVWKLYNSCV